MGHLRYIYCSKKTQTKKIKAAENRICGFGL